MKWSWPGRYALDPHAEFYGRALDLACRVRRPMVAAYHLSIAALVATALGFLAWVATQAADRALPVKVERVALLTPRVAPGGDVRVRYAITRLRVCGVDISASILDGADELRPLVTLHRDVAGPVGADRFTRGFTVPREAVPGAARLRVAWSYSCPGNVLQAFSPLLLPFDDIPFVIESR